MKSEIAKKLVGVFSRETAAQRVERLERDSASAEAAYTAAQRRSIDSHGAGLPEADVADQDTLHARLRVDALTTALAEARESLAAEQKAAAEAEAKRLREEKAARFKFACAELTDEAANFQNILEQLTASGMLLCGKLTALKAIDPAAVALLDKRLDRTVLGGIAYSGLQEVFPRLIPGVLHHNQRAPVGEVVARLIGRATAKPGQSEDIEQPSGHDQIVQDEDTTLGRPGPTSNRPHFKLAPYPEPPNNPQSYAEVLALRRSRRHVDVPATVAGEAINA